MIYDFSPHISGDTWDGIGAIVLQNQNNTPVCLCNAKVEMLVKSAWNLASPIVLEFTTTNDTIKILSENNGIITIPSRIVDIPVGLYKYNLFVTFENLERKSFLQGSWQIVSSLSSVNCYISGTNINTPTIPLTALEFLHSIDNNELVNICDNIPLTFINPTIII